ncbi:MAG TPA: alpha/beta hydrolase [Candidatus Dormibacteraeota bacterium]|nr:alpha/beta hydrolase [Candidatus Dormibacteraeota bacterium]
MTGWVAGFMVLVLLVVSACRPPLPGAVHSPSSFAHKQLTWSPCGGGFQCATLMVPIDYANHNGKQISLALLRKPATEPSGRIGSLLMNPGGPGESGNDYLRYASDDFATLNKRFDIVSWDPRGVGSSSPVECLTGSQLDDLFALDPVLDDPQEKQAYIQAQKDFASACWQKDHDLLPFMDSESTAEDMEQIRAALGDRKLTYLGFSYGTYLGQWYAHLYPKRVRAMVLDGVVFTTELNTATSPFDAVYDAQAFEDGLRAYIDDCPYRSTCPYHPSTNFEQRIEVAMAGLDAKPVAVGRRYLTRGLGLAALVAAVYFVDVWPDLDKALTALATGDGAPMLGLADYFNGRNDDGTYISEFNGALDATTCLDGLHPTADITAYDQAGPALIKASPLFGPMVQYQALRCAFWPVDAKGLEVPSVSSDVPPILLIGATGDPATSYQEAEQANQDIPGSVLLTRKGSGHTSYGYSACIDSAANNYLLFLVLPPAGTVCPG